MLDVKDFGILFNGIIYFKGCKAGVANVNQIDMLDDIQIAGE